jgi:preprotein translocase subunit SecB
MFNGVNSHHLETPDEPLFFRQVRKANTAIEINRDINQIAYILSSDEFSIVLTCTVTV